MSAVEGLIMAWAGTILFALGIGAIGGAMWAAWRMNRPERDEHERGLL